MASLFPSANADRPLRLAILGPTCSGKSTLALELAHQLSAEIISCDSMQVYRGMDVGTAKPSATERHRVVHHLIDILDISEPYSVSRFLENCPPLLQFSAPASRNLILVGGSGLYARAFLYGFTLRPADPAIARELAMEAGTPDGLRRLLAELASVAPEQAARTGANPRRLVRAVEVLRITGRPPEPHVPQSPMLACATGPWQQIIFLPPWEEHRRAIHERTRQMLRSGWIDETCELAKRGLEQSPTARQALGYPEVIQYLAGKIDSIDALAAAITQRTVQYARRQRTWFRHQHPGAELVLDWAHRMPEPGV